MKVSCPHCEWSTEVANEKIPTGGAKATCPKCKKAFEVIGEREPDFELEPIPLLTTPKSMKSCPLCGEEILAVAKKCKHCQSMLEEEKEEISIKEKEKEVEDEVTSGGEIFCCPKCGMGQPESETCINCGIIFSKFNNRKQRPPKEEAILAPASKYTCCSCKLEMDDIVTEIDKWLDRTCTNCSYLNNVKYSKVTNKDYQFPKAVNDEIQIKCPCCELITTLKLDRATKVPKGLKDAVNTDIVCSSCKLPYIVRYTYLDLPIWRLYKFQCDIESFSYKSKVKAEVKISDNSISETRATCMACAHIWHFTGGDWIASGATKLGNSGLSIAKGAALASGLFTGFGITTAVLALMPTNKPDVDASNCPKCHSKAIKYEQVVYDKPS